MASAAWATTPCRLPPFRADRRRGRHPRGPRLGQLLEWWRARSTTMAAGARADAAAGRPTGCRRTPEPDHGRAGRGERRWPRPGSARGTPACIPARSPARPATRIADAVAPTRLRARSRRRRRPRCLVSLRTVDAGQHHSARRAEPRILMGSHGVGVRRRRGRGQARPPEPWPARSGRWRRRDLAQRGRRRRARGALAFDATPLGRRLPTTRRQVNEDWMARYRGWVYGVAFGAQLSVGVATVVTSAAIYAAALGALLCGTAAAGAAVGRGLRRHPRAVAARRPPRADPDGLVRLHRPAGAPAVARTLGGGGGRGAGRWRWSSGAGCEGGRPWPLGRGAAGLGGPDRPAARQRPLPARRPALRWSRDTGEFGAGVTARMGADAAFAALVEYRGRPARPARRRPLRAVVVAPASSAAADFGRDRLQVMRPGHLGAQRFFTAARGRSACTRWSPRRAAARLS